MTTPDIILLIGVATTSIVTIISAVASSRGRQEIKDDVAKRSSSQDVKLDQIHEATNGGVQKLRDEIVELKKTVKQLLESKGITP